MSSQSTRLWESQTIHRLLRNKTKSRSSTVGRICMEEITRVMSKLVQRATDTEETIEFRLGGGLGAKSCALAVVALFDSSSQQLDDFVPVALAFGLLVPYLAPRNLAQREMVAALCRTNNQTDQLHAIGSGRLGARALATDLRSGGPRRSRAQRHLRLQERATQLGRSVLSARTVQRVVLDDCAMYRGATE